MKYLKLFEQFDENDPFGEETLRTKDTIIRVGDRVILINDVGILSSSSLNYPKLRQEYTVEEIEHEYLKLKDARGLWDYNRFKKI